VIPRDLLVPGSLFVYCQYSNDAGRHRYLELTGPSEHEDYVLVSSVDPTCKEPFSDKMAKNLLHAQGADHVGQSCYQYLSGPCSWRAHLELARLQLTTFSELNALAFKVGVAHDVFLEHTSKRSKERNKVGNTPSVQLAQLLCRLMLLLWDDSEAGTFSTVVAGMFKETVSGVDAQYNELIFKVANAVEVQNSLMDSHAKELRDLERAAQHKEAGLLAEMTSVAEELKKLQDMLVVDTGPRSALNRFGEV